MQRFLRISPIDFNVRLDDGSKIGICVNSQDIFLNRFRDLWRLTYYSSNVSFHLTEKRRRKIKISIPSSVFISIDQRVKLLVNARCPLLHVSIHLPHLLKAKETNDFNLNFMLSQISIMQNRLMVQSLRLFQNKDLFVLLGVDNAYGIMDDNMLSGDLYTNNEIENNIEVDHKPSNVFQLRLEHIKLLGKKGSEFLAIKYGNFSFLKSSTTLTIAINVDTMIINLTDQLHDFLINAYGLISSLQKGEKNKNKKGGMNNIIIGINLEKIRFNHFCTFDVQYSICSITSEFEVLNKELKSFKCVSHSIELYLCQKQLFQVFNTHLTVRAFEELVDLKIKNEWIKFQPVLLYIESDKLRHYIEFDLKRMFKIDSDSEKRDDKGKIQISVDSLVIIEYYFTLKAILSNLQVSIVGNRYLIESEPISIQYLTENEKLMTIGKTDAELEFMDGKIVASFKMTENLSAIMDHHTSRKLFGLSEGVLIPTIFLGLSYLEVYVTISGEQSQMSFELKKLGISPQSRDEHFLLERAIIKIFLGGNRPKVFIYNRSCLIRASQEFLFSLMPIFTKITSSTSKQSSPENSKISLWWRLNFRPISFEYRCFNGFTFNAACRRFKLKGAKNPKQIKNQVSLCGFNISFYQAAKLDITLERVIAVHFNLTKKTDCLKVLLNISEIGAIVKHEGQHYLANFMARSMKADATYNMDNSLELRTSFDFLYLDYNNRKVIESRVGRVDFERTRDDYVLIINRANFFIFPELINDFSSTSANNEQLVDLKRTKFHLIATYSRLSLPLRYGKELLIDVSFDGSIDFAEFGINALNVKYVDLFIVDKLCGIHVPIPGCLRLSTVNDTTESILDLDLHILLTSDGLNELITSFNLFKGSLEPAATKNSVTKVNVHTLKPFYLFFSKSMDLFNLPLFKSKIETFDLKIAAGTLDLRLNLLADYFNRLLNTFEPIIEQFAIRMFRDDQSRFDVEFQKSLEITATPELLQLFQSLNSNLNGVFKLINNCGEKIEFKCFDQEWIAVADGDDVEFGFENYFQPDIYSDFLLERCELPKYVQIILLSKVFNIPLNRTGGVFYSNVFGKSRQIQFSTSSQDFVLVISVHSYCSVTNVTDNPLNLSIESQNGSFVSLLKPKEIKYIPLIQCPVHRVALVSNDGRMSEAYDCSTVGPGTIKCDERQYGVYRRNPDDLSWL
ncbi:hypothetical protein ACOME3_002793 [Neoechinorhynchus agilis]